MSLILISFEPGVIPETELARVRALAPDKELLITNDVQKIESVLDEIEIAAGHFPRKLIPQAPNLRWVQGWGAGVDWLMRDPDAVDHDFVLTNASGIHAIPISEHIIGLMLAFARRIHQAVRRQAEAIWEKQSDYVFELANKTLLLIGVGAIGERTARLAKALDMWVIGIRRNPDLTSAYVDLMDGPDSLMIHLPEADFIVLTAPLTPETKGMIGKAELQAMKETAYIFNIGRGGTIQEPILIQALEAGWISGAGLDVFETEPLPADSPLWAMDNVIVTAHYAGSTPQYNERAMAIFLDNLERYVAGQPLRNVVNKQLGY